MTRALALVVLAALAGCGDDVTEIVVVVDSDLLVPDEVRSLNVRIEDPQGDAQAVNGSLTGAGGFPRTVGIVYEGGRLGPVTVTASALDGSTVRVERTARTFFQQDRVVMLRIDLLRTCTDVDCVDGETCREGGCGSIDVNGESLPDWEGKPRTRFTPAPRDAGPTLDSGPCTPATEACNERDDDCDTRIDETFDLDSDESNCGTCMNICMSGRMCCSGACVRGGC